MVTQSGMCDLHYVNKDRRVMQLHTITLGRGTYMFDINPLFAFHKNIPLKTDVLVITLHPIQHSVY
jgi:hypothetical protein